MEKGTEITREVDAVKLQIRGTPTDATKRAAPTPTKEEFEQLIETLRRQFMKDVGLER